MSVFLYLASDAPFEPLENPHFKPLSVNEALALGMKVPDELLRPGFDRDAPGVMLWTDTELTIDTEQGTAEISDYDDDLSVQPVERTDDILSERAYFAELSWGRYSDGRGARLLDYIRRHLNRADAVELWMLWLSESDFPLHWARTVPASGLTHAVLAEFFEQSIFDGPNRLTVVRAAEGEKE